MLVKTHEEVFGGRLGEWRRLVSTTAGRRQHGTDAGVAPFSVGVSVLSTQRTPPTNHIPPTEVSAADHIAFTLAEQPTSSNKIAVLRRGYSGCQEAGK